MVDQHRHRQRHARPRSEKGPRRELSDAKPADGAAKRRVSPRLRAVGPTGYRKLYTAHTETAASRAASVPLFAMAPSTPVDHHNVITEWKVYVTNRDLVDPNSRREILRIAQHRTDHSTDTILFNPTAKAGQADYGKLYIGTGDGGNTPDHPDMYNHAQDPKRALGKILRIDPLPQSGGRRYGVPPDNPHSSTPDWLPEIWAMVSGIHKISLSIASRAFSTTPISANTGSRRSTSSCRRQLWLAVARRYVRHGPQR